MLIDLTPHELARIEVTLGYVAAGRSGVPNFKDRRRSELAGIDVDSASTQILLHREGAVDDQHLSRGSMASA